MQKKNKVLLAVFGVAAAAIVIGFSIGSSKNETKVIPPTCTDNGYTIVTKGGKTQFENIVAATGHSFTPWQIGQEAQDGAAGVRSRSCSVCGYEERELFQQEGQMPQIYLSGDIAGIGKKEQVALSVTFSIDGVEFNGYASMKYQGHSSLQYAKKNYTMKLYSNAECSDKQKLTFSHWNPENKYILKANFNDISRSRNLICADIWSQMVATRENVQPRLLETSNMGAVDGIPVLLYLNEEFQGIYNLTLHKDDALFAMKDGQKDGILIINETQTPAAQFKAHIDWADSNDWEVEYCGTEDTSWLTEKLDRFTTFVQESSDEAFRRELREYADVDSLIDYLLAIYALGLPENSARDLILATYEDGVFFASLFDMEAGFGMKRDATGFYEPGYGLPQKTDGVWTSGTDSLLWDRLLQNFYPEICSRYRALRKDVLSTDKILSQAAEKLALIDPGFNQTEMTIYPTQPLQNVPPMAQINEYTTQRLALLDEILMEENDDEQN